MTASEVNADSGLELAEVVGQIVALKRFPIEPLGGEAPNEIAVRADGPVGDRIYEIVGSDGAPLTWRTAPELLRYSVRFLEALVVEDLESWARVKAPDGREFAMTDPAWLGDIAQRLGREISLRRAAVGGSQRSLHLISRSTLRFVERVYGMPLEPLWLRANFVIELAGGKAFEEDDWAGRQLRIGDTLCEVLGSSHGCLATTLPPEKSGGDLSMVDGLLKVRGGSLGVELRASRGQRIRLADPVCLVD